jgi:hypothetical protein
MNIGNRLTPHLKTAGFPVMPGEEVLQIAMNRYFLK